MIDVAYYARGLRNAARRLAAAGWSVLISLILAASATAQSGTGTISGWVIPTASDRSNADPRTVARVLSFADLGYGDGVDFGALEGEREFYFPVSSGPWLQAMRLVLPYQSGSVVTVERSLTVLVGERVVHQSIVARGAGQIVVPLAPPDVRDGRVRVRFIYKGARTNNRCFDRRTVGDYLKLASIGGLQLDIRTDWPMTVGVLAGLLPRDLVVVLPATPNANQAAAALTVVASRGGGRIVTGPFAPERPEQGIVEIAGETAPGLSVKPREGLPILVAGGADPAAAVRLAFSSWNEILRTASLRDGTVASRKRDSLSFRDLGADFRPVSIAEGAHEWAIVVPAGRLPPATRMKGVQIAVAFVADGTVSGGVLSAWVNGTMIANVPVAAGGQTTLRADVPKGASRAINLITVRIDRGTQREDCGEAQHGFPAQLLDSSKVVLDAADAIVDFSDFATSASGGLTVIMADASQLALAARAIVGVAGMDTPITVRFGSDPTGELPGPGPCLFIGNEPPANSIPRLRFAEGRMVLEDSQGIRLFDLPTMEGLTAAELLRAGDRSVVWIRPATNQALPGSMWLDQGDVAFADGQGIVKAVSAAPNSPSAVDPLAQSLSPGARPDWRDWYARHSSKVHAGAVLLLIVVGVALWVVWIRRPSRNARADN